MFRRAFKKCFKRRETLEVSKIRPTVLSEVIKRPASDFSAGLSEAPSGQLQQFLLELGSSPLNKRDLVDAQKLLINLKTNVIALK